MIASGYGVTAFADSTLGLAGARALTGLGVAGLVTGSSMAAAGALAAGNALATAEVLTASGALAGGGALVCTRDGSALVGSVGSTVVVMRLHDLAPMHTYDLSQPISTLPSGGGGERWGQQARRQVATATIRRLPGQADKLVTAEVRAARYWECCF